MLFRNQVARGAEGPIAAEQVAKLRAEASTLAASPTNRPTLDAELDYLGHAVIELDQVVDALCGAVGLPPVDDPGRTAPEDIRQAVALATRVVSVATARLNQIRATL